jgi:hypothetical protein
MLITGTEEHWIEATPNVRENVQVHLLIILCLISNASFPGLIFGKFDSQRDSGQTNRKQAQTESEKKETKEHRIYIKDSHRAAKAGPSIKIKTRTFPREHAHFFMVGFVRA